MRQRGFLLRTESPIGFKFELANKKSLKPSLNNFDGGADTVEQQFVVKVAHEYAHVVQDMFDAHLLKWLDGSDDIPQEALPYVQLYATLSSIGGLHGLSQMNVYHTQSRTTGNLSVPVYEDMAETIGSYLLGNEYFLYRIQNAHGQITQEQAEELVDHVMKIVSTWEKTVLHYLKVGNNNFLILQYSGSNIVH